MCWFSGLSVKDRNSLNSIVKLCSKIKDLSSLWEKVKGFIHRSEHALSREFVLLPSSHAAFRKTKHFSNSFILSSIQLINIKRGSLFLFIWL